MAAGVIDGPVVQIPFSASRRSQPAFVVIVGAVIVRLVAVPPAEASIGFVLETPLHAVMPPEMFAPAEVSEKT